MERVLGFPTLQKLTSDGLHHSALRFEKGRDNLKPENAYQIDLSIEYSNTIFHAEANLYNNYIENYIYLHKTDQEEKGYPVYNYTQANANIYGVDVTLNYKISDNIDFNNIFSLIRGDFLDGGFIPNIPANNWVANLHFNYNLTHGYIKSFESKISSRYFFAKEDVFKTFETKSSAYILFDVEAHIELELYKTAIILSASIQNVLDTTYQNHLSRLRYAPKNLKTNRIGVFDMGRNFSFKLTIPIKVE